MFYKYKWLRLGKQNRHNGVIISMGFGQSCPVKSSLGSVFVKLLSSSLTLLQRT